MSRHDVAIPVHRSQSLATEPHGMNFGQMLRSWRQDAGLTQEAVAQKSGVSVRTVSRTEADSNYRLSFSNAMKLVKAVGKTLDDVPAEVRQELASMSGHPSGDPDLDPSEPEKRPRWVEFLPWANVYFSSQGYRATVEETERLAMALTAFADDLIQLRRARTAYRAVEASREDVANAEMRLAAYLQMQSDSENTPISDKVAQKVAVAQADLQYARERHQVFSEQVLGPDLLIGVRSRAMVVPDFLIAEDGADAREILLHRARARTRHLESPPPPGVSVEQAIEILTDEEVEALEALGREAASRIEPPAIAAHVVSVEGDPGAKTIHRLQVRLTYEGQKIVRWLTSERGIPREVVLSGVVPVNAFRMKGGLSVKLVESEP